MYDIIAAIWSSNDQGIVHADVNLDNMILQNFQNENMKMWKQQK